MSADVRNLVRRISRENPLWGAPRIHGELLKLGIEIAQSTVAKYMVRRRGPPSQRWKTFLRNHAPDIASIDLFVVPTIGFKLLYGLAIIHLRCFGTGARAAMAFTATGSVGEITAASAKATASGIAGINQ